MLNDHGPFSSKQEVLSFLYGNVNLLLVFIVIFRQMSLTPEGLSAINKKLHLCPNSNLTKPEDLQKLTGM